MGESQKEYCQDRIDLRCDRKVRWGMLVTITFSVNDQTAALELARRLNTLCVNPRNEDADLLPRRVFQNVSFVECQTKQKKER